MSAKPYVWPKEQEHLKALFDAYIECTGIDLTSTNERRQALRELDRRGITSHDVSAVIGRIKWHLEKGTKGYTDSSLDWRNVMAPVDTFEERALKLRQEKQRKVRRPAADVAQSRPLPDGGTVNVIAPLDRPVVVPDLTAEVRRQIAKLKADGGK